MSATAHKKANRSAIKQAWNHMPPKLRLAPPVVAAVSWWAVAAAPESDQKFTELARERNRHPWSNVVPTAMNRAGDFN